MPSHRVPAEFTPNRFTRLLEEKRRSGRCVLDLTRTNPTQMGLGPADGGVLESLADRRALAYEPDPRGLTAARQAVARYLAGRGAAGAAGAAEAARSERIYLTASTSEAYAHLFRLFCDTGDEVLVPRPSYPLIEPLALLEDVHVHAYRLAYDGRGWRLDVESLEAAITPRTRAIVVVQPNNPTGSCLDASETARLEAVCRERRLALIADEVFGDFPHDPGFASLPSLLGDRSVPTFVLGGLSKCCGLPQLKLGWIAACGPEEELARFLPGLEWILDLFLSVGAPVMWAAERLLDTRGPFQAAARARIAANLGALGDAAARGGAIEPYRAEGGWSAIARLGDVPDGPAPREDVAEWALRRHDVSLHPAHFYDLGRDDLLVLSLLTEPDVLREALARMAGCPEGGTA
ncbi:MAG: pyridoxal phosphate-dependent aminotransferase [Hyphomicrobiales bacterium]